MAAKKKKPSERLSNQITTYTNDDEHLRLMKRMIQKNLKSTSEYLRQLVLEDIAGTKP